MGVAITELEDGFRIKGKEQPLKGAKVDSHGDHRIAMSLAVAALVAEGETTISNAGAVDISFPTFWDTLDKISGKHHLLPIFRFNLDCRYDKIKGNIYRWLGNEDCY